MRVFVDGVGLRAPGLNCWAESRSTLLGANPYLKSELVLTSLDLLPAAERRRTGLPVKLALNVGLEALASAQRDAETLASVFTSSGADGQVIHQICESLASAQRDVSPTRFHNSVHNAPAGYWSIALRSKAPSTSLCCFDWSFVAGLLEASTYCATEGNPVLLVSYDAPYPDPLHAARPITGAVGVALLLSPAATAASMARLDVEVEPVGRTPTSMRDPGLEALRMGNPAGRALPLLRALAGPTPGTVILEYLRGATVTVAITPC